MKFLKILLCLLLSGQAFAMEDNQKELAKEMINKLGNVLPSQFRPKTESSDTQENNIKRPKAKRTKVEQLTIPKNNIAQLSKFNHYDNSLLKSVKEQFFSLIANAKDEKDLQLILLLLNKQSIHELIFKNPEVLLKPLCQLVNAISTSESKQKQIKYDILKLLFNKLQECYVTQFKPEDYKDNNLLIEMVKNNIDLKYLQMCLDLGFNINAQDDNGLAPLHYTAQLGNLDTMKSLIKLHADHNILSKNSNDLLILAALNGQKEIITYLINELKFDINFKNPINGATACFTAVANGHLETLKLLVNLGADYNVIANNGYNLLLLAAYNGQKEIIMYLINELKFDINFKDFINGITACHYAAKNNKTSALLKLIEMGANIKAMTKKNESPLKISKQNKHLEIVKIIENKILSDLDQDWTCPICANSKGELTDKPLIVLDCCCQVICNDCFVPTVANQNKCPMCKATQNFN